LTVALIFVRSETLQSSPTASGQYYPGYYAADAFEPDGHSFEVVHKSQ
jgi:hypothetical protein